MKKCRYHELSNSTKTTSVNGGISVNRNLLCENSQKLVRMIEQGKKVYKFSQYYRHVILTSEHPLVRPPSAYTKGSKHNSN